MDRCWAAITLHYAKTCQDAEMSSGAGMPCTRAGTAVSITRCAGTVEALGQSLVLPQMLISPGGHSSCSSCCQGHLENLACQHALSLWEPGAMQSPCLACRDYRKAETAGPNFCMRDSTLRPALSDEVAERASETSIIAKGTETEAALHRPHDHRNKQQSSMTGPCTGRRMLDSVASSP